MIGSGLIETKTGMNLWTFFAYGTNLEIVNLEAFRRRDIREWLDAIESYPEGIYKLAMG